MSVVTQLVPKGDMRHCGILSGVFKTPEMHIPPWYWFRIVVATGERPSDWHYDQSMLQPPNQLLQFRADSDDAACARVSAVVELIEARRLSPDSDARKEWDSLFAADSRGGY